MTDLISNPRQEIQITIPCVRARKVRALDVWSNFFHSLERNWELGVSLLIVCGIVLGVGVIARGCFIFSYQFWCGWISTHPGYRNLSTSFWISHGIDPCVDVKSAYPWEEGVWCFLFFHPTPHILCSVFLIDILSNIFLSLVPSSSIMLFLGVIFLLFILWLGVWWAHRIIFA